MPTATKLFSSLWFCLLGWLIANAHVPALGEGVAFGRFREVSAVIGLLCGWRFAAPPGRSTDIEAISNGLKIAIVAVFFALLIFSTHEMVGRSMYGRYEGPMDAVMGIFELMLKNLIAMGTVGVLGLLILGGGFGGMLGEYVRRRWR